MKIHHPRPNPSNPRLLIPTTSISISNTTQSHHNPTLYSLQYSPFPFNQQPNHPHHPHPKKRSQPHIHIGPNIGPKSTSNPNLHNNMSSDLVVYKSKGGDNKPKGGGAHKNANNNPTNKSSKIQDIPVAPATKASMSFVDDTYEDDDGNVFDIDTAVQQIGLPQQKKKIQGGGFQGMDLAPEVYQGIKSMGFNVPTPIQRQAIPILLEGADVVAMARTGSGKTAAFTIPMLHRLATNKPLHINGSSRGVRAVVLSPTRELAQQTHSVICKLGKALKYRTIMLIGGQALSTQFELLSNSPDIIVATPGRLVHHLIEVQFSLQAVEFVCFDEADRLFEMGFAQQLYEILKRMNENRQTCLFSATMPQALIEFSRAGLKSPVSVRLDSESKLSPDLQVSFFHVKSNEKNAALMFILKSVLPKDQQAIVFVSTRHHVDFLVLMLQHAGIRSTGIYGQMDADGRVENIGLFKSKKARVLVVTDLAARGIDIPLLDNVIHYDFPTQPKLFIHRSGRVARAGRHGTAFTLVAPDDMAYLIDLYLFFAWPLPFIQQDDKKSMTDGNEKPKLKPLGADDDDDDNDERLGEKKQELDRLVDFGLIPTSLLDFEVEHCNSVIKNNDLERLVIGCDNAYEKYSSTSKGSASKASMDKWRSIRSLNIKQVIDIHPWFMRQAESDTATQSVLNKDGTVTTTVVTGVKHNPNSIKNMITAEKAKDLLSSYTPNQTVFELHNRGNDVEIIRQKRLMHDRVIVDKHGLREVVGDKLATAYHEQQALLAMEDEDYTPIIQQQQHTVIVKVAKDLQQGSKVNITAADRRKRKNLDEKYKNGNIDMKTYIAGLRDLPTQLQSNPVDQDPSVIAKAKAQSAITTTTTTNTNQSLNQTNPHKDGPPVIDLNAAVTRSDRPPMLAGLFNKGPVKRPLPPAETEEDKAKNIKNQQQASRQEILKQLLESASTELNIKDGKNNTDGEITQPRKKKRGQLTQEERRDNNYISLAPVGNRYEELGLSIGNSRLEDMSLELAAEDGEGRRVQQKTRKWSEHAKKFVTIYSTKDAFGKVVTNEAGQKVNKDYVAGSAYAEWRNKNRKLEQIVDMDDGDNKNNGAGKPDRRRRPPRGGFKSVDDDGKSDGNRKYGRDARGKTMTSGVLSASAMLKNKKGEEKERLKAKKDAYDKKKKGGKKGGR